VSDIDTAAVDSLKVLDPNRPIREATGQRIFWNRRYVPQLRPTRHYTFAVLPTV